jgi:hypothetical protein
VRLELVTSGGRIVAAGDGRLDTALPAAADRGYLFVRAVQGGQNIAYSSPVWITTRGAAPRRALAQRRAALAPAARPQRATPSWAICVL